MNITDSPRDAFLAERLTGIGGSDIGERFNDNSGRRYCGPKDTMANGAEWVYVNTTYVKVIVQTPFGPSKWYEPKQ